MAEYEHVYTGSFCVFTGYDEETGQDLVLITLRGEHFKGSGTEGYGTTGGFVEIRTRTEQPRDASVRELGEEIVLPDGSPVLSTVTADRLKIVASGIDYSKGKPGTLHAGIVWHGHRCELTPGELKILKAHVAKMAGDPDYAAAIREATNQETGEVLLVPARDLIADIRSGRKHFAYPHEAQVVLEVAEMLVSASGWRPAESLPRPAV